MNPQLIRFMKISIPTSFAIILLSACGASETYADSNKEQRHEKIGTTTTTSNTGKKPENTQGNKPDNQTGNSQGFADQIRLDVARLSRLNQEKITAQQRYNKVKNKTIVVTKHGQTISNKVIYAGINEACGIDINGYNDVKISNVTIYHANNGICVKNAARLKINGLQLISLAAPTTGPHCERNNNSLSTAECWGGKGKPANSRLGLYLSNSSNAIINNISSFQSSSAVYALNSNNIKLSKVRCLDMRGPLPRGQCVQFNATHNSSIDTFYAKNIYNQSYSEDNINAYYSNNIVVKNGLIDGNWSIHGIGIIADTSSDNMQVSNIDFLHMSNAAINVWSNEGETAKNFTASKLRIKDSQCYSRKEGVPSTGGLIIATQPTAINPNFNDIQWYNHCRSTTNWCLPGQSCRQNNTGSLSGFRQQNFTTKWTGE